MKKIFIAIFIFHSINIMAQINGRLMCMARETQDDSSWCSIACFTMVNKYLLNDYNLTQCQLVKLTSGDTESDCCKKHSLCHNKYDLNILCTNNIVKFTEKEKLLEPIQISKEELINHINAQNPIIFNRKYNDLRFNHEMIISGYIKTDTDLLFLFIIDPLTAKINLLTYDAFIKGSNYSLNNIYYDFISDKLKKVLPETTFTKKIQISDSDLSGTSIIESANNFLKALNSLSYQKPLKETGVYSFNAGTYIGQYQTLIEISSDTLINFFNLSKANSQYSTNFLQTLVSQKGDSNLYFAPLIYKSKVVATIEIQKRDDHYEVSRFGPSYYDGRFKNVRKFAKKNQADPLPYVFYNTTTQDLFKISKNKVIFFSKTDSSINNILPITHYKTILANN